MCGISGCIVKDNPKYAAEVYYKLIKASEIRGQDGTGVTILSGNQFITKKWDCKASKVPFLDSFICQIRNEDMIIGQNRYAIFGMSHENDQPLIDDPFALTHNGVLYDYEKQYENFIKTSQSYHARNLKVDTELILDLLFQLYSDKHPLKNMPKVLRGFKGEAACLLLSSTQKDPQLIAFMKNKILYSGEDDYGNIYFFSTLYIKNKIPQINKNIYEFKNNEVRVY